MTSKKMTQTIPFMIWMALYPALLYYAILYIASTLALYFLAMVSDITATKEVQAGVLLFANIVTIPFIFSLYANDRNAGLGIIAYMREHKPSVNGRKIATALFAAVIMIFFGFALNNIISMTPLIGLSKQYEKAHENLFAGSMAVILLRSAFFVPILEELTFRGVILFRMQARLNKAWALAISSVLFGAMHMNLVQIPYALCLGIVLGLLVIKTGHIYPSIVGHMAVNGFTVLRAKYNWFSNMADQSVSSWLISVGCFLIAIGLLLYYLRSSFFSSEPVEAS